MYRIETGYVLFNLIEGQKGKVIYPTIRGFQGQVIYWTKDH